MAAEIIDVVPGLWLWRSAHPDWTPGSGWDGPVTSACVRSESEVALLDPLAPPPDAIEVWSRIDASPPTIAVILKPDHVRDVDLFVRRYGARAFGPWLFYPGEAPRSDVTAIEPGSSLLLYSDGLTECLGPEGTQFGMANLTRSFADSGGVTPREVVRSLRDALDGFRGGVPLSDDLTILAAKLA